jgi:hypothetical protein
VIRSIRAAKRSFNAAVSPGTATNVPEDCSLASAAAAWATGSGVSMN